MSERTWQHWLPWVLLFAVAMAFLESAVVVYLRALYYPDGFRFPLVPIDHDLGSTEVFREVATIVMLLAPGALITRSALERFAWFCFCFGVWDIFYYVWLKVLLDWPVGLMDWDILFLVPVPWVGPVLAPCIVSGGLIALAVVILHRRSGSPRFRINVLEWTLLLVGVMVMLFSFMEDYFVFIQKVSEQASVWSIGPGDEATFAHATTYVPQVFPWWIFLTGCGLSTLGLVQLARRSAV